MIGKKVFFSVFLATLAGLIAVMPALAFPPLPSSFYGRVQINGQDVPDGTLVRGLIGGKEYAQSRTQTYQGHSVYSLNVAGDDASTPDIDGGRDGETVQFEVGGILVEQTGQWHTATNVEVNLMANSSQALNTPGPAPTPILTQTPMVGPAALNPTMTPATQPGASKGSSALGNGGLLTGGIAALVLLGGASLAFIRRKK